MYEIQDKNLSKPIDAAVKKEGEWVGMFSGKTLKEIQKEHPNAQVVNTKLNQKKSLKR